MIKTTHVGSLPRGPELVPLLLARDHGEPYDAAEFDRVVQAAVDAAVAQQVAAGVSIVSDGELGKVGYSTYIIERLSGFGGHTPRKPARDLAEVPELAKLSWPTSWARRNLPGPAASARSNWSICNRCTMISAVSSQRYGTARRGRGGLHEAASPGLITAFQPKPYLPQPRGLSRRSGRCDAARI